jgi:phosphoserine phosphatase
MATPNKGDFTGLILVSGVDKPGITSSVINKLAEFSVEILDIKQIVVGQRLLQTILIKLLPDHALAVETDLELLAKEISADIAIDFSQENTNKTESYKAFFMLVEQNLDPKKLAMLTECIQEIGANILNMQIDKIAELTGITFQAEFTNLDFDKVQQQVKKVALSNQLDIYFDTELLNNGDRKLFVFDMDSTLIGEEVIDQLAEKAGVATKVKAITEKAMAGELDFTQSLKERVNLLSGLPVPAIQQISASLTFNPGVLETLSAIKKAGHKVAVVSGGFLDVIKAPLDKISIDYIFANKLEIKDGLLTGQLEGEIMNSAGKAHSLRLAAEKEKISLSNTVVVGDGANDLEMMAIAGHSFAYNAKEIVRTQAHSTISHPDMRALLLFTGVK